MPVPHQNHSQQHHGHDTPPAGEDANGAECVLCPVCVLLQAVSSSRPEVTQHLVAAGRELTRALAVLLEGHDDRSRRSEQRLQRISVD